MVHFGGMEYDRKKKTGIKKRKSPSPRHLKFKSRASYEEVMRGARHVFFPNGDADLSRYSLANSAGVPYEVLDKEKWTLGAFIKEIKLPLSKIRLYKPQVYSVLIIQS